MNPRPMICVQDVVATSRWYQAVLGLTSGHGGDEYEMLMDGDRLVMQLHRWAAHEHRWLGDPAVKPYGNGVALWFQTDEIDAAFSRAVAAGARIVEPLAVNPLAHHREFWMVDPAGYVVVVAGRFGDVAP
jgi:predicted enzyme related to lactoylglutathione lyase